MDSLFFLIDLFWERLIPRRFDLKAFNYNINIYHFIKHLYNSLLV